MRLIIINGRQGVNPYFIKKCKKTKDFWVIPELGPANLLGNDLATLDMDQTILRIEGLLF